MLPDLTLDFRELEFHNPWLLALIPPIAYLAWRAQRRRYAAPSLVFPSVARLKAMPRTWRVRASGLVPLFHVLAAALLVAAAARPREGDSRTIVRSEGIAIQMVVDISGSMEELMQYEGRMQSRLDVVKQVFTDFISGSAQLPGRKTDVIGLTTFARFTEENCPLVSDHAPLLAAVQNMEPVKAAIDRYGRQYTLEQIRRMPQRDLLPNPLNRTAIGDGIMRAVYSLITAEEDLARGEDEGGYKIKSKVILLLTDGEDNASEVAPIEAGRFAAENDIRLYYVLVQDDKQYITDFFGRQRVARAVPHGELLALPRRVAGDDARAFLATDGDALLRICREIDAMERVEIGKIEYRNYNEKYHIFLLPGLALLLCAVFCGETLLRRIP